MWFHLNPMVNRLPTTPSLISPHNCVGWARKLLLLARAVLSCLLLVVMIDEVLLELERREEVVWPEVERNVSSLLQHEAGLNTDLEHSWKITYIYTKGNSIPEVLWAVGREKAVDYWIGGRIQRRHALYKGCNSHICTVVRYKTKHLRVEKMPC